MSLVLASANVCVDMSCNGKYGPVSLGLQVPRQAFFLGHERLIDGYWVLSMMKITYLSTGKRFDIFMGSENIISKKRYTCCLFRLLESWAAVNCTNDVKSSRLRRFQLFPILWFRSIFPHVLYFPTHLLNPDFGVVRGMPKIRLRLFAYVRWTL